MKDAVLLTGIRDSNKLPCLPLTENHEWEAQNETQRYSLERQSYNFAGNAQAIQNRTAPSMILQVCATTAVN